MRLSSRNAIVAACAAALAACGGGGGGGESPGGPRGGGGLQISPASLEFTFVQGGTAPGTQDVQATWTAADTYFLGVGVAQGSTRPVWLRDPTIHAYSQSGTISFGVDVSALAPATYTAALLVGIARSDGSIIGSRDLTITVVVHPAPTPVAAGTRLLVGAEGVALTSTPGISRLSRTLAVGTNRGPAVAWTAASSQGWLHVAAAGTGGSPLVLTADPTGLACDAVHEAVVTVASADPGLSVTTQEIRVGLWVGADAPAPVTTVTASYRDLAADPVRPYVYLVDDTSTITVRNVHTGAAAGAIVVPGAALQSPVTSADGARLYVLDTSARKVVVVDLATRAVRTSWPLAASGGRIAWTRTGGVAALLSDSGHVYAPETGTVIARFRWYTSGDAVVVSRDGTRVCTVGVGMTPYEAHCASLDGGVGALGPAVIIGAEQSQRNSGFANDVRLAPDGSRLYVAGGSLALAAFDATTPGLPPAAFVDATTTASLGALVVDPEGRVWAGGRALPGPATLFGWDAAGQLLHGLDVGEIAGRGLALSGDGLRAIAVTVPENHPMDLALIFLTLP